MTCDVCNKGPMVGVAAVPGMPVSVAYCGDCLRANAHPYGLVVVNTAMIGGYDEAAAWWQQIVDDTLAHLGLTRETFDADVAQEAREQAEAERDLPGPPL